jgi:RNA polymerase sigma factor (sigma-70 family)
VSLSQKPHSAVSGQTHDTELVRLAAAGDADAFNRLYDTYSRFIEHKAAFYFGAAQAEDVAQTAWLWLLIGRWRVNSEMPPNGRLYAFLAHVVRFAGWSLITQGSTREVVVDDLPERVSLEPSPEQQLLAAERAKRLEGAVHALPPYLQVVAELRFVHELSGADIAQRVNVRPATIPPYFAEIRRRLRADLADVYDLPAPSRTGHMRVDRPERYAACL